MTEKYILSNEQDYKALEAELNARKKPSQTLRYMMRAFESYRQSKKMGWSRSWNKYHVVNFQSFKLNPADAELCRLAKKLIDSEVVGIPEKADEFINELMHGNSPPPMGFLFFQEYTDQGRYFEGAVLSYGRVNTENRRFRDRFDLILESEVINGVSQGLSRIRLYVDPYIAGVKEPLWQQVIEQPGVVAQSLFEQLARLSWSWADDNSRIWSHWVTDYIDYFGDRQWAMQKSYFHHQINPDCRIEITTETGSPEETKAA